MRKNKIRVCIHFVWTTWDRLPLIAPEVERSLLHYISRVCDDNKCDVLAVNCMEDHVHLLVNLAPTICMADLMKDVKGGSSRLMTTELRPGEWFQWQGHYGAFSVSPAHKTRVIEYIRNQKAHHANSTLWREVEEPTEEFGYKDDGPSSDCVHEGGHSSERHPAEEFIPTA